MSGKFRSLKCTDYVCFSSNLRYEALPYSLDPKRIYSYWAKTFFLEGILEILDINDYFLDEIATRFSFFRILSLLYELSLRCVRIFGRSNTRHELKFRFTMVLELTGRVESTGSKHTCSLVPSLIISHLFPCTHEILMSVFLLFPLPRTTSVSDIQIR